MEDEALIVCVQEYRNLYDLSDQRYHNKNIKFNSWQEIGMRLNQPAEQCKSRWQSIRDCYRKALLKRETKSGQAFRKLKPWRLEQQMEFVKPFVNVQREQESNISDDELHITTSVQELSTVTENTEENPEVTENTSSVPRSESTAEGSASTAAGSASTGGTVNEEFTPHPKRPSHRLSSIPWKKKIKMTPTAAVFQEYVNFKKQQSGKKSTETASADHLTKYFQGVEETVRIFPAELQIKVKSQISRIIHEAELEAINN